MPLVMRMGVGPGAEALIALEINNLSGKKLSHRRSNFPSGLGSLHGRTEQGVLKLEA